MREASELWLQFISAVQWLGDTARPGLTPIDALEEALREGTAGAVVRDEEGFDDVPPEALSPLESDPLGAAFLAAAGIGALPDDGRFRMAFRSTSEFVEASIGAWTTKMAAQHNDGMPWPHPSPVQGWPRVASSPPPAS